MKKSGDNWQLLFHPAVRKDLSKLGFAERKKIRLAVEKKLAINPILYGTPLRGNLKQLWKLRMGDIRIIFAIEANKVKIVLIANRKDVYKLADKRIY